MNTRTVVPDWLHDIFLGYGDPSAAQPKSDSIVLDYVDTFLSKEHLKAAFPGRVGIHSASEELFRVPLAPLHVLILLRSCVSKAGMLRRTALRSRVNRNKLTVTLWMCPRYGYDSIDIMAMAFAWLMLTTHSPRCSRSFVRPCPLLGLS